MDLGIGKLVKTVVEFLRQQLGCRSLTVVGYSLGANLLLRMLGEMAEALLLAHNWPGNVRELKGAVEAAANLAEDGEILATHLRLAPPDPRLPRATQGPTVIERLADVEQRHILAAYDSLGHNKSRTARALGIGLQTLHRKLKAYGVK